ncbi:MAG TPA: acyl-CoA dehydrogenase, partial [Stellaceae bacterium]|nr:acyl-CoA dehydrogenase [Stellaceae bacterium]
RDVRITAIYEGTTGIQANDLIGRKIGRDGGATMQALIEEMRGELEADVKRLATGGQSKGAVARQTVGAGAGTVAAGADAPEKPADTAAAVICAARDGIDLLRGATRALLALLASDPAAAGAVAVPYLKLCGFTIAGWLMARAASIAARGLIGAESAGGALSDRASSTAHRSRAQPPGADRELYATKLVSTRFYAEQILPQALALARIVSAGSQSVVGADARWI